MTNIPRPEPFERRLSGPQRGYVALRSDMKVSDLPHLRSCPDSNLPSSSTALKVNHVKNIQIEIQLNRFPPFAYAVPQW
ncbi:hypothetical protein PtB15_5B369 [Puccinia triticina]|nr:hypothetical protein PtB15_5B369 [Puccinia triticina]